MYMSSDGVFSLALCLKKKNEMFISKRAKPDSFALFPKENQNVIVHYCEG
jgi:hypothetical protein